MTKDKKRQDGFTNVFLGTGLKSRDPLENRKFTADTFISDQELATMYYGNGLIRRIVDLPSEEAVKNWLHVCGDEEEELSVQMLDDLNAEEHYANALRWSRAFGGSAILMMVDDGGTFEDEINEGAINGVESIRVFDKREVILQHSIMNDDIKSKFYGIPEWIQFNPANGTMFYAHRSRVLIFDGEPLPNQERANRQGWGLPVMQGLFDAIANNDDAHRLARLIMERMSQSVTKFDGLIEKLSYEGGEQEVITRLHLVDMARSVLNTVAIDSKDEFQLFNMSLTNIPEMIDRFGLYVSALTGIPFTILFGRSPAGMNATGQSDLENFYGMVKRLQKRRLKINIDRLIRLLMLSKHGPFKGVQPDKWKIEFEPLWMPSDKERAETEKLEAEADKAKAETAKIYVDINALDGSEVRAMLEKNEDYQEYIDVTLDLSGESDDLSGEVIDDDQKNSGQEE